MKQHMEIKLSKQSPLDSVLTVYILNVGEYVNEKLFDYYLIFARLAHKCYFEHG
jgi:hypothetical protein